jgi:hypothetical protein
MSNPLELRVISPDEVRATQEHERKRDNCYSASHASSIPDGYIRLTMPIDRQSLIDTHLCSGDGPIKNIRFLKGCCEFDVPTAWNEIQQQETAKAILNQYKK